MAFLNKEIKTRVCEKDFELIQKIIQLSDVYESPSHYVRCCIMKDLRSHRKEIIVKKDSNIPLQDVKC